MTHHLQLILSASIQPKGFETSAVAMHIEMSALHPNKDSSEPTETSNPNFVPSYAPLSTNAANSTATTHHSRGSPSLSASNNELRSIQNPFALPFQTLITRSQTPPSIVKLFVRTTTLSKIPFAQKIEHGELKSDEDFWMMDHIDDSDSFGLLFGFVEAQRVPHLTGNTINIEVNVRGRNVSRYVRAYLLAQKLGLEKIQNEMVDRLVEYHLENPVTAPEISMLVESGVAPSELGMLLIRDLARDMIDGSHRISPPCEGGDSSRITTKKPLHSNRGISAQDNQTNKNGDVIEHPYLDTQDLDDGNNISHFPSTIPFRTYPRDLSAREASINRPETTEPSVTSCAKAVTQPLTTITTNPTSDTATSNIILEEIRKCWTIEESITLITMMIEAHQNAKSPTSRSPMELAAADPCTMHIHSITEICQNTKTTTVQKRKRAASRRDGIDEDGIGSDGNDEASDDTDDIDDVCSSSSEVNEAQGKVNNDDKENAEPDKGIQEVSNKAAPPNKKRRIGWPFG